MNELQQITRSLERLHQTIQSHVQLVVLNRVLEGLNSVSSESVDQRVDRVREQALPGGLNGVFILNLDGRVENEASDRYTEMVDAYNASEFDAAKVKNQDGVAFLKSMFDEEIRPLTLKERKEFQEKIDERDPALFVEFSQKIVGQAISSPKPLKKGQFPAFLDKHLEQLEELRQQRIYPLSGEALKEHQRKRNLVSTLLMRSRDFIASIEGAASGWSIFPKISLF